MNKTMKNIEDLEQYGLEIVTKRSFKDDSLLKAIVYHKSYETYIEENINVFNDVRLESNQKYFTNLKAQMRQDLMDKFINPIGDNWEIIYDNEKEEIYLAWCIMTISDEEQLNSDGWQYLDEKEIDSIQNFSSDCFDDGYTLRDLEEDLGYVTCKYNDDINNYIRKFENSIRYYDDDKLEGYETNIFIYVSESRSGNYTMSKRLNIGLYKRKRVEQSQDC